MDASEYKSVVLGKRHNRKNYYAVIIEIWD